MTKSSEYRPKWPFLVGGITGVIEISITYPLEFIKNSLQLQPGRFTGMVDACHTNVKNEGLFVLYRGFPSWLVFAFPRSSLRFSAFQLTRDKLSKQTSANNFTIEIISGFAAGLAESIVLIPMQNLSIKMTHDANLPVGKQRYSSFFNGSMMILKESGLKVMTDGASPLLLKTLINQSIRFPVFHGLTRVLGEYKAKSSPMEGNAPELGTMELWLCGAGAGCLSAFASHPVDVVKANMMGLKSQYYRSSFHCFRSILSHHGVNGLYSGIIPRTSRVCMEVGILFSLFEKISRIVDNY